MHSSVLRGHAGCRLHGFNRLSNTSLGLGDEPRLLPAGHRSNVLLKAAKQFPIVRENPLPFWVVGRGVIQQGYGDASVLNAGSYTP